MFMQYIFIHKISNKKVALHQVMYNKAIFLTKVYRAMKVLYYILILY